MSAPKRDSQSPTLTWLHLADFQLREGRDPIALDALLDDIVRLQKEEDLRLDLVCVAGDIAFLGQPHEYRDATKFLNRLLRLTGLSKDRLIIVPGNHDIDQKRLQSTFGADRESSSTSSSSALQGRDWAYALDPFSDFVAQLGVLPGIPEMRYLAFPVKIPIGGRQIAVVILNTAWMGDVEPCITGDALVATIRQFREQVTDALQKIRSADVKIALLHHPLDEVNRVIRDQSHKADYGDDAVQALLEECDFVLHSHADTGSRALPSATKQGMVVVDAGSDPGVSQHPNVYNWVQVNFENPTITVHMRSLFQGGAWGPDPAVSDGSGKVLLLLPRRLRPQTESQVEEPEPVTESAWRPPFAGYAADIAQGEDRLNITPDVNAFCSVFASKEVDPPLCLGLFGDWGAGKTFFMDKMWERIELLKQKAAEAEKAKNPPKPSSYYSRIVQIRFNAWHYMDTNLWACLADHIFKEFAAFLSPAKEMSPEEKEVEEARKAKLFRDLETAKKLRETAALEREEAQGRVDNAEEELKKAREAREKKVLELRDLTEVTLQKVVAADKNLKDKLDEAVEQIHPSQTIKSAEELDATLQGLGTFWGKIQASLRKPDERRTWGCAAILVLAVIPAVALALNWVLGKFLASPQLISAIACALAEVAAVLGAINQQLKPVLEATNKLRDVRAELNRRLEQKRTDVSEEEQALLADLILLRKQEATKKKALAEAQARLDEAQAAVREIEEMKDERRLARFIQERITSQEYEKNLGIISTVHNDFKSLSEMLGKGDDDTLPRIDRIILYIDDLDRCPEQKVVDVLQALHLLLAFPLFIVVVGVDSRWLLRSLEQSYPALKKVQAEQTELSEEEMWAWETTPQNYLEKIFQIPFHLHQMDREGVGNLIDSLLAQRTASPGSAGGPAPVEVAKPEEVEPPQTITPVAPPPEGGPGQGTKPQPFPIARGGEGGRLPAPVSPLPELDLTPPALEIKPWEKEFIPNLFAMLPTPRDVKRFVNIYRLIRAQIEPKDLDLFVGDQATPGEYQAVMILMAILTGFPRQACEVFDEILNMDRGVPWSELVDALTPEAIPNARPQRFSNGIEESLSAVEAQEWKRLHTILCGLEPQVSRAFAMATFRKWVPRVARFSFRAGKIAEGLIQEELA